MEQHVFTAGTADGVGASAKLSPEAAEYAATRGLSRATLVRLGVASGTAFFPELGRKSAALFFKYRDGWKARAYPEKAFVTNKGFKLSFWNEDAVLANKVQRVFLTEGEFDACALVEAGIAPDQVMSVPNGAAERTDRDQPKGYGYVEAALGAGLSRVEQFIWCGDNDVPGLSLRSDMAQMLGAARFSFVEWPEGTKDPNDVLKSDGVDYLRELVTDGARLWPVDGLYRLADLPEPPPLTLWHPGFPEWERKVLLAPRTVSVATGHPGHGKTQLWTQIWFNIVKAYNLVACIASFETQPKPYMRRILRTLYRGALENNMDDNERRCADAWINERYLFLQHRSQRPTIEWLLDTAEVAVVRHGARIVQIDPWNRLEATRGKDETETDYIGRCLRTMHAFANDLNCHVQVLVHPAKMHHDRRNQPPHLEDISGSKNWDNMADQGFAVHRPKMFENGVRQTSANFYCRKARFADLGYPCMLALNFDLAKERFVSVDYEIGYRGKG
jgi:twinkle protein